MGRIVIVRLFALPVQIAAITALIFVLMEVMPGDPIQMMLGEHGSSPEQIENLRAMYGLDKPLHVRYVLYLSRLFKGTLGSSLRSRGPVLKDIARYFPASLEIILLGVLIAYPLGIFIGSLAAAKKGIIDSLSRFFALLGSSAPVFWSAIVLQIVFFSKLNWFPAIGRLDVNIAAPKVVTGLLLFDSLLGGNWPTLGNCIHHLFLPVTTLVLFQVAVSIRMTRASMLEVIGQPYVTTARSKGLREATVIVKHALRNSLVSLVTTWGIETGKLISGLAVIETVFAWPGLGRYIVQSVLFHDYYSILGSVVVLLVFVVLLNTIADIAYVRLNPKLRYE